MSFALVLTVSTVIVTGCAEEEKSPEFIRLMNLGKAYLENRDSPKAIEVFSKAVQREPESAPALRNLARAYRLARQPQQALQTLEAAARVEPESVATSYLVGLALTDLTRVDEAVAHFEEAVRLDPRTAALRFQLARAYQAAGRHDDAAKQLNEALRIDPLHAAAHFKLATYARQQGDKAGVEQHMREFIRLRKLFGEQTRSAEALEQCTYTFPEPAPEAAERGREARPPSIKVVFSDVSDAAFANDADRAAAVAAVLDVDEAGRCTLVVGNGQGRLALLKMSSSGTFERTVLDPVLPAPATFHECLVGDFHDDVPEGAKYDPKVHALNDVLLAGPSGVRLLKRSGPESFRDVTLSAGLDGVTANAATWVDYEHDGDLDLLFARSTGLKLWQNNGDGRFERVTADAGIGDTGPAVDVAAVDLDSDVAVDLIVARGRQPTLVFENQRAGRFATMLEPPGPWPAARLVLADDLNNDGYADALLIADREALVLSGFTASRSRIDLANLDAAGAALLDYDNDGWLDLCVVGVRRGAPESGAVRLFRNMGGADWKDTSGAVGLASVSLPPLDDVLVFDADADGDTDVLLLTSDGRMRLLRNNGGHVNGQLKIRLTTIKTNPTGIGTHIELRKDTFWLTRSVSRLPIELGLGGRRRLDAVQTLWTNGVVDNQIDVPVPANPMTIVEKNVATGSCPFLYAWDGRRFRFVTDILGNSPIGLPAARDVMLPADADEIVLIGDADFFPPREGTYTVTVTDEFREVLYLDYAKLIAVDHSPDLEVHPSDKLMAPPFPPSDVWALGRPKKLLRAVGDDGLDRTAALRAVDGEFAPPGRTLPPPYRGMCEPMSLVMDFGPLDASKPLVLALTGWLQYGDASTNIAMSQDATLTIIPPTLEVQIASGRLESQPRGTASHGAWEPVDVTVGMPAGKTKTILCDLSGRLPKGARRLRLTTTFEIRWDRIALLERAPLPAERIHELPPRHAYLGWRGFSRIKQRAPGHPTTPDFDTVLDRPPWRTALQGWCTRYGDVLKLVAARDGRLVVLNAGDALSLGFDAALLPRVPGGLVRTFFFYSVGWDKDGDHNVAGGDLVGPLPTGHSLAPMPPTLRSAARVGPAFQPAAPVGPAFQSATPVGQTFESALEDDDWRLEYNTRWVPRDRFRSKDDYAHPGPRRR